MSAETFDPARTGTGAAAAGPVFVSRTERERARVVPLRASDGSELPRLFDTHVRWMLLFAFALQAYAWWRIEGYQLADSVEFMERARAFVRGEEMVDSGVVRPIGFSFLLMPFFVFGEWFGIRDERALVWCVVLLQMTMGLLLTWRCMRIGACVAGRTGAIAAGFLVATNPVFLQYSTQPVSDLAAGVCIAYALEGVIQRGTYRRALIAGLWLGVAFMIAYKTLLVTMLLVAYLFLRDRFKHSATWRGIVPGVLIAMLVQCTLDWVMYGAFGESVRNYLAANFLGVVTSAIYRFSVYTEASTDGPIYKFGTWLYAIKEKAHDKDWSTQGELRLFQKQHPLFYLLELPTFLVWPAIVLGATSLVRVVVRRQTLAVMLAVLFISALVVMSFKGSKDFRLVLPLLPLLAPLLAYGWDWIVNGLLASARATRGFFTFAGCAAVLAFSWSTAHTFNVKHFGGYWDASDWVDAYARETFEVRRKQTPVLGRDGEPEPLKVGCAYHWAVYLRHTPLVEMVKLPWQLNLWSKYADLPGGGMVEKGEDFATLEELDLFIVHLPILSQNPDLMRWVNAHYEVAAALYDQRTYDDLGPIFILKRRAGALRAKTFFEVTRDVDPGEFVRTRQVEPPLDFLNLDNGDRLELLGVEFTTLPPQDFGWVTYHWRAPRTPELDYWILDRVTSPYEVNVWENNHVPAYGCEPTSQWTPDEILSESYLLVPAHRAYESLSQVRPMGNAYRRGDLIPTRTWMKLVHLDPDTLKGPGAPVITAELVPARPGEARTVRTRDQGGLFESPDGIQFAADDFVRVARFFVPVLAPWRLADDGRTVED
ncbi:MAG: glycosyltransferase family 39 protein [Planctomycetes bacterium]|nr:glycosyltransferase family 39 protein [Planctomycetota bacterium]